MKHPIEKSLIQYFLILGAIYQLYQCTFDVLTAAPLNSIFINIIVTMFFLLLLLLVKLEKSTNLVAALLHFALLPAFVYFWYYNGGISGIVPFILCMYIGLIIATTNGPVMWISLGLYAGSLTVLLFFPSLLGPGDHRQLNLESKPVDYIVVALVITLFTIYLKNKFLYYRQQVALRNDQLERVALTLFNQNEELTTQQEEIKAINENLENIIVEHTRGIENKNQELSEYAFINAHMLRGPLSRILGLTNLMENDPHTYDPENIRQIRKTAQEIDEIIKEINAVLN